MSLDGTKEANGVRCLAHSRLSTWEFLDGLEAGPGRGVRKRDRPQNSKEEATVRRRLVGSWGPDTHLVWSCGLENVCVCTSVGGCVCVCKTNNWKMNLIIRHF